MCGLAGIVDLDRPVELEGAVAMARLLAHRGPDDADAWGDGTAALAFRRLAILDLSEAGRQPMADAEGRYRLVHNGEIYNYRELRTELAAAGHRFRTGTDTEVVLAGYREWGARCVERFRGMWALAIWDARERRLFASRDRFGIKPFFYRADGSRLAFGSELKAFRAGGAPLRPALGPMRDFLAHGVLDHGEESFVEGVLRLPPAHSLVFDAGGLRLERYWRLELRDGPAGDPTEAVREAFLEAVRFHLRSDVPVGTALSGGLDSSAIVGAIEHLRRTHADETAPVGGRQQTFTVWFGAKEANERPFAEAVVDAAGADPHWVTFGDEELVADLPAIVESLDEPFASTSNAAHWYVMRAAREAGMTVMLDGQGGDEVFAGYPTYFRSRLADLAASGRLGELGAEAAALRSVHGIGAAGLASTVVSPFVPRGLTSRVRARLTGAGSLLGPRLGRTPPLPGSDSATFPDRLRRRLEQMLVSEHLPQMLRYEDRNSMAHSIEARVPFLDHPLVELVFSLDGGQLIRRGRTKDVLRRAVGDLLPRVVRERTDKQGFPTPQGRWLAEGALGKFAEDVLQSRELAERGFVDAAAARAALAKLRRGERTGKGAELWRAVSLELWSRSFLDAPAVDNP